MFRALAVSLVSVLLAGCSLFGARSGYEQPPYEVVDRLGESIEVRRYAPRVAAEASVEASDDDAGRNAAFRLLFDYITGENRTEASIAMTTPVETAEASEEIAMTVPVETTPTADGRVRMRFFLPADYSLETAPAPRDPRVRIVELPEQTAAVLRFSGSRRESAVTAKKDELLRALPDTPWRPAAAPVALFYDPPWTLPFFRRNEVAVAVAQ